MHVARVGGKGWGVHDADVVAVEQDLAGNEMNEGRGVEVRRLRREFWW